MARIIKGQPLPHHVFFDTSILWCEDKAPVVNPNFEQFWTAAIKDFDLRLLIPDTVWGELKFQHCASCIKQLKNIEEGHKRISSIAAVSHSTSLTPGKLETQILAKFDKWARARRAEIIKLPVTKIDWERVAMDAIWRRPPFTSDPKNAESEKGFRDALILETVVDGVRSNGGQINFAFICNDQMLRESAIHRLKEDPRFSAFESTKEFESYLRLTKEQLTKEFIAKIRAHASRKFFLLGDESSLYNRDKLFERISNEFKAFIEDPTLSEGAELHSLLGTAGSKSNWSPAARGKLFLDPPEFLRIEGGKRYFWLSRLVFGRIYRRTTALFTTSIESHRLMRLPFEITWSAMVKNDARFHDLRVDKIDLKGNTFALATEEGIKKYGPLTPPQSSDPLE